MNFEPSREEKMLEDELSRLLKDASYPDVSYRVLLSKRFDRELYRRMCTLGFVFPGDPILSVVSFRVFGRHLFISPALDCHVSLYLLSKREGPFKELTKAIVKGEKIISVAFDTENTAQGTWKGERLNVQCEGKFAFFLEDADGVIVDVETDGGVHPVLLLKGEYQHEKVDMMSDEPVYTLKCDTACTRERVLGDKDTLLDARCMIWLLSSAELLGIAEGAFSRAVKYSRERVQFGRPIGSFQAIRHMLADDYMNIRGCGFMVNESGYLCKRGLEVWKGASALAFMFAAEVSEQATKNCHQIHGAMGFTVEMPVHLYYKKAKSVAGRWFQGNELEKTVLHYWRGPLWIEEEKNGHED